MRSSSIVFVSLVGIGATLFASGCADAETDSDRVVVGTNASAISGGQSDFTNVNVAAILWQRPSGEWSNICSGTLIAPNVVLTAGHCTYDTARLGVSFDQNLVTNPVDLSTLTVTYGDAVTHPEYEPIGDGARDSHDLGVIVLDTPVNLPVAVLPSAGVLDALKSSNALKVTTPTQVVGYGNEWALGLGNAGAQRSYQRKVANKFFSALLPSSLKSSGGDGKGCFGDSGGATFMTIGGVKTLVGVNVVGDGACASLLLSYRTDVPAARAFLGTYVALP